MINLLIFFFQISVQINHNMRVQLRIFSFLAVKTFDLGVQKNRLFEYPDHIFYIKCLGCSKELSHQERGHMYFSREFKIGSDLR